VRDGGDHFEVRVQQVPEGLDVDVEQTDNLDGLYHISFVLTDPGPVPPPRSIRIAGCLTHQVQADTVCRFCWRAST
jgi:hypothetical protein